MEDKDFKVGDLVRLKKAFGTRYAHPFKTPEQVGIGVVIEKLSELFIYPQDKSQFEFDFQAQYEMMKNGGKIRVFSDSIKTRICRVYWLRLERTNWEYEDDLSFADDEETDSPIITK